MPRFLGPKGPKCMGAARPAQPPVGGQGSTVWGPANSPRAAALGKGAVLGSPHGSVSEKGADRQRAACGFVLLSLCHRCLPLTPSTPLSLYLGTRGGLDKHIASLFPFISSQIALCVSKIF